ncbi:MAG: mechanosensitive ion channel family protein [Xanthomonadales bacterium]|nr:mechanosensitive ion channel family protein [Gammaproteobacteria bacterium]NNE05013.1 mechanosensitive ion channel family protein [Xanthomonadales bacterium]NNL94545.1 mechanosensitive ion channel family protein [Xanthomonadales bacterium]
MNFVTESLQADWQAFLSFSPRLLYAGLLLLVFASVASAVGKLITRVLQRSEKLRSNVRFVRRIVVWSIRVVGILLALGVMGFQGVAASLLATGGVVAIVLGFAFREIGENLLAGIFLTFSRPFELGDLVKTGDLTGTVRAIDIRSVHIRTEDACDVFVPNAQIFREELYNYTRDGLRRPGFRIGVAYHDDPSAVADLLQTAVARVPNVLSEPQAFVSIENFADSHVVYGVYFWMDTTRSQQGIVSVSNAVKTACWKALSDAGMTFSTDVTTALEIKSVPELTVSQASS